MHAVFWWIKSSCLALIDISAYKSDRRGHLSVQVSYIASQSLRSFLPVVETHCEGSLLTLV
jgi:hypothetical protein